MSEEQNNSNENITAEENAAQNPEPAKETGLGKFQSVEALMSAYLNLEAEFTRRSQRLKELERSKAQEPSEEQKNEQLFKAALASEEVKNAVIGEYLQSLSAQKGVPLVMEGANVTAPAASPKSVKEAGALAKQFLKN